jgi:cytochrome P450
MTIETVLETGLPAIAYEHAQSPQEAHGLIRQARQRGPIAMGPHGPEVLTYDLVRTVLRDDRFVMPKGLALAAQGITSGELWDISLKGLLSLDGAEHHRQRRLVSKAFTPKAAERLRTTCADIITGLVDHHASTGRCDVVADIARQYPIPIICSMLGTPPSDWHLFSDWADDIFKIFDWNVVNDEPDILRAWRALEDYLDDMVTRRRDALTDDLLSDMTRAEVDGDRLAHDELLMLAATLLMAGTDTTRNQLAAAVQVFCDHPDQWALLAENPGLAPKAVEGRCGTRPSSSRRCARRSRTSNSVVSPSPPARSSSPTPPRPTATRRCTTTRIVSTSPARTPPPCSPSVAESTTAWVRISRESNSPKP